MKNEEYFEQMFPSLVNADAFTIGKTRFLRAEKVLEIIDSEIADWERVMEETGLKPYDDNAEAALAILRAKVAKLQGEEA